MSSEAPRRIRESGGAASSPIGSTAAIIIAVLSVIGGFLILREIRNGSGSSGGGTPIVTVPSGKSTTSVATGSTVGPSLVSTTAAPTSTVQKVTAGATVIVVNASITSGAASLLTTALKGRGFTTAKATNIASGEAKYDVTKVFYDSSNAAALPVANYLAFLVGGVAVEKLPSPPPVKDGKLPSGVTVVLMLGNDKANKTLDQMGGPSESPTGSDAATTTSAKKSAATSTTKKGG